MELGLYAYALGVLAIGAAIPLQKTPKLHLGLIGTGLTLVLVGTYLFWR